MSLYKDASLVMIPTAYKDGRLYSIRPVEELGDEEVTNGTFDTDSDWIKNGGATISGGKANIAGDGSSFVSIAQNSVFTSGKEYKITLDVTINSGLGLKFQDGASNENIGFATTSGHYVFYFTASANTTLVIGRRTGGTAFNSSVDNVSVKEVLVNGDFDFSRGSNLAATRVDVNGLIEKGRENLLLQSNQFDTTWIKASSLTLTSGQSGYNGSSDAWKLESDGSSGYDVVYQDVVFSNLNTYSIYAKAGTNTSFSIRSLSGTDARGIFDLSAGSVSSTSGTIDASIVSVGGDWYRCSITFSGSNNAVYIYPNALGAASAGYIYIQDAQLEAGLVATDYIETGASTAQAGILEDMPRLDYSGGASCPALLLEPQRSNLIANSEYIDSWSKIGSPTLETNYGISPEGLQNSTRIQGVNGDRIYIGTSATSNTYSYSIYAKGSGNIKLRDNSGAYNLPISLTSEWERYDYSFTSSPSNIQIQFESNVDGEIYGVQLESGSYPTSYIPTYGSSVTRSVDSCLATSVSDLIGQTQGTMFVDVTINNISGQTNDPIPISLKGSGSTNSYIALYDDGRVQAVHYGFGSVQANINLGFYGLTNGRHKFAFVYSDNDFKLFIDGALAGVDTTGLVDAQNAVHLGYYNTAFNGAIKNHQSAIFPTALTDSECIALTTI